MTGVRDMTLNVRAFAVAFAVWWGVAVFLLTWWLILLAGATGEPTFLGRIYVGYGISPLGSVIGLVWGAIDALIAGAIFAWLYNTIAERFFAEKEPQAQG